MRTRILARPSGRDYRGRPLVPREFVIDRAPEPFGASRARIFIENPTCLNPATGQPYFTPMVVVADSIEYLDDPVGSYPTGECDESDVEDAGDHVAAKGHRRVAVASREASQSTGTGGAR